MSRFSLLFFVLAAISGNAQIKYEKHLFIRGADTLPYKLLKPQKKYSDKKNPLIIFFHGATERGRDNEYQTSQINDLFSNSAVRYNIPCYLIAPQCPQGKKWVDMDWTNTIHTQSLQPTLIMMLSHELIDSLKKVLNIDTNRIYVTGFSMGGFAVWDYCARYTNEVAAAVPVCGGYDVNLMAKIKKIPLWVFHGDTDTLIKTGNSRQLVRILKKMKANVKYSELLNTRHNAWNEAYKNTAILNWMFEYRLRDAKIAKKS